MIVNHFQIRMRCFSCETQFSMFAQDNTLSGLLLSSCFCYFGLRKVTINVVFLGDYMVMFFFI